jgi:hypothetical protein
MCVAQRSNSNVVLLFIYAEMSHGSTSEGVMLQADVQVLYNKQPGPPSCANTDGAMGVSP